MSIYIYISVTVALLYIPVMNAFKVIQDARGSYKECIVAWFLIISIMAFN